MKTVSNGRARITDPVDLLRDDMSAIKRDLAALVTGRVNAIGSHTRETLDRVGSNVKAMTDQAKNKAEKMHGKLGEATGARPLTTIAVAAVAGVVGAKLIGWMWRR